jgi:hypothetical protein
MIPRIIVASIVVALIVISVSIVFSQQQFESENKFQVYKEEFKDVEWNNEITKILPREELEREWTLLWSDGTEEFVQGQYPIMIRKTIVGNEILFTSYNYAHIEHTYQILIWKGELVSEWIPKEAIENIFSQTNAKINQNIEGLDLIPNCVVGYYDIYGDEKEIKNELLFSECAKKDYRIRVNLVEGEYNQDAINKLVFLSNLAVGKI